MPGRLSFRDATRDDTPQILGLLNQTFRTQVDPATWQWYVYDNPLGHSRVYVAHDPDGVMVGVIGFAPISLRIGGVSHRSDFAHHLVLTPAYRDTLSFVGLNRHALDAQATHPIKLAIGPPNRTAYPIHKTIMKWVDFGHLEILRKLKPSARPHAASACVRFPETFDPFYDVVSRDLAFCVDKNQTWMNWRFCRRPGSPYTTYLVTDGHRVSGYVILKRWKDDTGYAKAHIMDLHALDQSSLQELLAAADSYGDGCDEINLWAAQGYRYRDALVAAGFAPNPAAHQPLIARTYDRSPLQYPAGPASFMYGDSDTLY